MSATNEPQSIPLPPLPASALPGEPDRAAVRLDLFLATLVLLLVVFLSLFPLRNTDFWLHLAGGRALVNGPLSPSSDPFSYTAASSYWVNHSWLSDILLYGAYQALGGPVLIVLKALLLAALAAVMMAVRRRELGLWVPAVCTALALLPMSGRFHLQPIVLSLTLLGLTFFLLTRAEVTDREPARLLWFLPPLFALWVNLDPWFFVGLLAVALYLIGQILAQRGRWRLLALVFLVSLAACLLNPFTYQAFRLPTELTMAHLVSQFQSDDLFRYLGQSAWQTEYLRQSITTIAGAAFWPLVGLGLVSFLLNAASWRWGRTLVWLGFLGLAVYHVRAIPFFAVVAGPITALNLQEFALRRPALTTHLSGRVRRLALLGRAVSLLALLALLVLAWPGWLHGFSQENRRVGLAVEIDPDMLELAEQLPQWRREGKLKGHGFNLSPEVANLLVWLCPEEARDEVFYDLRPGVYPPEVAREYLDLRRSFQDFLRPISSGPGDRFDWVEALRKRGITHVVVHDQNAYQIAMLVQQLLAGPTHWALLHLDSHVAVFGLFDPPLPPEANPYLDLLHTRRLSKGLIPVLRRPAPCPFDEIDYDPSQKAFHDPRERLPSEAPRPPRQRPWWAPYVQGPGRRPRAADEALVNVAYFNATRFPWHYQHVMLPMATTSVASYVGASSSAGAVGLGPALGASLRYRLASGVEVGRLDHEGVPLLMEGPIAPLLLATRRARQAILDNPDVATGYLRLGQSYFQLSLMTAEQHWGASWPLLTWLRQYQMVAAFHNALLLKPDLVEAHAALAELYRRLNYQDLAFKHFGEQNQALRRLELSGQTDLEHSVREDLEKREKDQAQWDKQIKTLQNEYAVRSAGRSPLEKAQLALNYGLARTALDVLLNAPEGQLSAAGARMELDLLLATGGLDKLQSLLTPPSEQEREQVARSLQQLGNGVYQSYRFLLAAVEGDYTSADQFLEESSQCVVTDPSLLGQLQLLAALGPDFASLGLIDESLWERLRNQFSHLTTGPGEVPGIYALQSLVIAQTLMSQTPQRAPVPWLVRRIFNRQPLYQQLYLIAGPQQEQADYRTLRGILALEAGDPVAARRHLQQTGVGAREYRGLPFRGRPAAAGYLKLLEPQKGMLTPNQNWMGVLTLTARAMSKRSVLRSTNPNQVTSTRRPAPSAWATGP